MSCMQNRECGGRDPEQGGGTRGHHPVCGQDLLVHRMHGRWGGPRIPMPASQHTQGVKWRQPVCWQSPGTVGARWRWAPWRSLLTSFCYPLGDAGNTWLPSRPNVHKCQVVSLTRREKWSKRSFFWMLPQSQLKYSKADICRIQHDQSKKCPYSIWHKNSVFGGRLTQCNRSDNYEKIYDISVAIAYLVPIITAIKHTSGLTPAGSESQWHPLDADTDGICWATELIWQ